MSKIIISVRVYNRPNKIEGLLKSMSKIDLKKFELFFFVDGPKNQNDILLINQSIQIIKKFRIKKTFKIFEQKKNLGLKKHWIYCMDQTFLRADKAIFLEDDLILSHRFFDFIHAGLIKYEKNKKIKSICGHVPIKTYAKEKNSFAWRPSVWGFGTWRRTWLECKQFMSKANKFNFNYKFKKKLLKHGHDLHIALGKNIIKKQRTFGVWWAVNIIIKKGLNLYPSETLVDNNGFDGSGSNCSITNFFKQRLNKRFKLKIMPDLIEPDIKFASKISKKILYSKTESALYLFLNPNTAFKIISSYLFFKKIIIIFIQIKIKKTS